MSHPNPQYEPDNVYPEDIMNKNDFINAMCQDNSEREDLEVFGKNNN